MADQPTWITLAEDKHVSYPSEVLNRVITPETIPQLTTAERRAAYTEMSQSLYAVGGEIQLALARASLPPQDFRQCEMDDDWLRRAKTLRNSLGRLLWEIRQYERDAPSHPIIEEAGQERQRKRRRAHRQQALVDIFVTLVEEKIGEEATERALKRANALADKYMEEGKVSGNPSVLRRHLTEAA